MNKSNDADISATRRVLSEILADYRRDNYNIRLWDGSYWLPPSFNERVEPCFTMVLSHPSSLRSMFERPSMLNLGEAFLSDSFDIEGDLLTACEFGDYLLRLSLSPMQKIKL